jgi:uncharacterized hydrophobic protein (TIGR00271 family)
LALSAGIVGAGRESLALTGELAPGVHLLAVLLLGVIGLAVVERSRGSHGNGNAYQLSRMAGSRRLSFATGWIALSGYVCLAGINVFLLEERVGLVLRELYDLGVGRLLLIGGVLVLAAIGQLAVSRERWRTRTVLVLAVVAIMTLYMVWTVIDEAPGRDSVLRVLDAPRNVLAGVALLGVFLWALEIILEHRGEMRDRDRTLAKSFVAVGLALVLAAGLSATVLRMPDLAIDTWRDDLSVRGTQFQVVHLGVIVLICAIGLMETLAMSLRLVGSMARDGFLPEKFASGEGRSTASLLALLLVAIPTGAAAFLLALDQLVAGAALGAFVLVPILLVPPMLKGADDEKATAHRLPLYPLVPGMAIGVAVLLAWLLPAEVRYGAWAWVAVGAAVYLLYSGRRSAPVQQQESVVGMQALPDDEVAYRVLACAAPGRDVKPLVRLASAFARERGGEVLVLQVVPYDEQVARYLVRSRAQFAWETLDVVVRGAAAEDVTVRTVVRIAPSVVSGILETLRESKADLAVLDWPEEDVDDVGDRTDVVQRVFASTSRAVAILQGELGEEVSTVSVCTDGGPHASSALRLASRVAGIDRVRLVHVKPRMAGEDEMQDVLRRTVEEAEVGEVERQVVVGENVRNCLVNATRNDDVVFVGASEDRFLGQSRFGGVPVEIARERRMATVIVKRPQKVRSFWWKRIWGELADRLPNLSITERAEVFTQMRHAARASVDFYVLITLAAGIATFGLYQNSGAVIIGAMLVAPLMSPMLALAHGLVQGHLHMVRRGAASTFKGIAVAIAVGTFIALLIPLDQPTPEILARASPRLVDLYVAIVSGAAASYAVSRKSVAAALPGVAIAAALVPPLCVVGYGLGSGRFDIAGGSLLLFLTNLTAIVLVSLFMFLLLGFRPSRVERGARVRQGFMAALILLGLLALPLGVQSMRLRQAQAIEREIRTVLREAAEKEDGRLDKLVVEPKGDGFLISAVALLPSDRDPQRIEDVRRRLQDAVGVPIEIDLALVRTTYINSGSRLPRDRVKHVLRVAAKEAGVSVRDLGVERERGALVVSATLFVARDGANPDLALFRRLMEDAADRPVILRARVVMTDVHELGPGDEGPEEEGSEDGE